MNSLLRRSAAGTVRTIVRSAATTTFQRWSKTKRTTGVYAAVSQRLMGLRDSSVTLPRIKSTASAGVSVTARIDAKPIEYVLVKASGLKRRPSVASRVKTGKNEIVMTRSEKKIDGPTSCIA